jgi:sialate O-acetylesterase
MSLAMTFVVILRLALASNVAATEEAAIRVVCIGGSITFGFDIKDREHASYAARLQSLLGEMYEVRNFGVSGATLNNRRARPYAQQGAFRDALNFRPHAPIIMLGIIVVRIAL